MSTYEPGTVAVATVRGVKGVRVFRREDHHGTVRWETATSLGGWVGHDDSDVTDVRPLVVLDLAESIGKSMLPDWLRNNVAKVEEGCVVPSSVGKDMRWLADQIEAQTKPPRIAEPTEPLAEVMAATRGRERRRFVRGMNAGETKGRWVDGVASWSWSELIDPTPAGEGAQS